MPINEIEEFFVLVGSLLFAAAANGLIRTMVKMVAHQGPADAAKRFLDGRDLNHDVGAIALVFNHFLETANLSFDAPQAF